MFQTVVVCLALLSSALGAAKAQDEMTQDRAVTLLRDKQKLIFAVGAFRPPYANERPLYGLEIDLVRAIGRHMGKGIDVRPMSNTRGRMSLLNGHVDGVSIFLGPTENRAFKSDVFVEFQNVFFGPYSEDLIESPKRFLSGNRVIAFQNARLALGDEFADMVSIASNYQELPSQVAQIQMLSLDRVDYVVGEVRILDHIIGGLGLSAELRKWVGHKVLPATSHHSGLISSDLRDAYNASLANLRASGQYEQIVSGYPVEVKVIERDGSF